MNKIEETVTIATATVSGESKINAYAEVRRDGFPYRGYYYTVEIARETFKTYSVNQCFGVGDRASVLFRGKKCEMLYDAVFYTAAPVCLDSPLCQAFFGDEPPSRLADIRLVRGKKRLFVREKKRRAAVSADPDRVAADALIIRRESKGEWQIGSRLRLLRFVLTVLVKTADGYAVTFVSGTDRIGSSGVYERTFDFSTGETVPILYRPDNLADNAIDYDRVKPFSFGHRT